MTRPKRRRAWARIAKVWSCVSECSYSKWFGGWPRPEKHQVNYTHAQHVLMNDFDIVWYALLKDRNYLRQLQHRYNATDIPLPHSRRTMRKPHNFTKDEIALAIQHNPHDIALYNDIAQQLRGKTYKDKLLEFESSY